MTGFHHNAKGICHELQYVRTRTGTTTVVVEQRLTRHDAQRILAAFDAALPRGSHRPPR